MTTDALRSVDTGVRFNVLGPLTVTEGTDTLNIGGPKQRTVLAMLISRAGRALSADLLVDAVYGVEAGPRSRRTIQTFVSTLRGELGDVIVKASGGWKLSVDSEAVDSQLFEHLVGSTTEAHEGAGQVLREALALWNGHPYSDVEAHGHLDGEISRLNELRLSAQSSRIDADLASGRHGDLVGEIEALMLEHPYQEHFRAQHMLALYRAGRQQEALASYRQMRTLLTEELGIDPSPELQELELRILDQDSTLHATTASTIQRKAVLVADPGDPLEIARLDHAERETVVARASEVVDQAVRAHPGAVTHSAGTATYALFEDASQAAAAAEAVVLRLGGEGLRMAIDWGDVEIGDDSVTGPPVTRASRLVAVSHRGQVLLSADAQQALSAGGGPGLRFETLGSHALPGLENHTAIYQLLVGDPPRQFSGLATDRLPPPLPGAGHRSVPGYELREPFGRGSIGELYTAYQPSVGRQVLVEVIPRSIASDPDFIRRFEADVQRLWLLDHPNINSVVDYWRDPEGAFVVYRWHRGGLLDVTEVGNPDQIISQVGSALEYAHSYGLVHGSLAPDRILLDETGNGYLLGFPIASAQEPPGEYPEYIAPENLDGSVPGVTSDVYALGMLALELDQGRRVAVDSAVVPDNPTLSRALDEDPEQRFGSVSAFLSELVPRDPDAPDTRYTKTRNPYKGLAAFHESDVRDFFGRSDLTNQLIERLAAQGFLAVVGPSGSGKSSVVRAGLIPAVRQGRIPGSDSWLVTDMLPGSHPFLELRRALERVAVDMPPGVMDALASESADAMAGVGSVLPTGASLLLLVDQFEELFTLVSEETRSRFIDLLATAVSEGHARIVVTLRADFLDRPLAYSELADLFDRRVVTVGSPTEAELREAITQPAAAVGVEVAPVVVERMINEVQDRPGALPLLQHTLAELFAGRDTDLISTEAYETIGGVSGSLGNRAEGVYQELGDDYQLAATQLFLRLVTIIDESAPTRKRVRVTSLDDLAANSALSIFTAARLLVVDSDPDTRTPTVEVAHEALLTHWPRLNGWIESAREDLTLARRLEGAMHEWQRNGRDDAYLLTGARLAQHRTWTTNSSLKLSDEESDYLERSEQRDRIQRFQRRRRRNWITGGFAAAAVVASIFGIVALNEADRADEAAVNAKVSEDIAQTQAERANTERDRANAEAANAENAAKLAKARELAASAISVLDTNPELATLLAVEAFELAPPGTEEFPEGMFALRRAVTANRLAGRISASFATDVAFTPDGEGLLVVDGDDNAVRRYAIDDLAEVWSFNDPEIGDEFFDVAVHPTSNMAVVTVLEGDDQAPNGRVIVLNTETGTRIQDVDLGECIEVGFGTVYFSSDGSLLGLPLVAPDCDPGPDWGGYAFFDTTTWVEVHRFEHSQVTMTDDMSQLLVDRQGEPAELLAFPSLELIESFDIDLGSGGMRAISPDGSTIFYRTGNDIDFRPGFWDVESNTFIGYADDFEGFFVPPTESTFIPGASNLMLAPSSESDAIYDVSGAVKILELPTRLTVNASISPDGRFAATANHGEVLLWDISDEERGRNLTQGDSVTIDWINPDRIDDNGPRTTLLAFDGFTRSPHPETGEVGSFFYTSAADLDPATGEVLAVHQALAHAQLPDGRIALLPVTVGDPTNGYDDLLGPLLIWDPVTKDQQVIQDCQIEILDFLEIVGSTSFGLPAVCSDGTPFAGVDLAVSPDGQHLATISVDPQMANGARSSNYVIQIWDLGDLSIVGSLSGELDSLIHSEPWVMQHFGDGWIALFDGLAGSGNPNHYDIIDTDTGELIAELGEDVPYRESFEVSPDGSAIYLLGESGELFEYDTQTWELVRSWQATDGRPRGLAIRDDGQMLAATGEDALITIWNIGSETPFMVDRIPMPSWVSDLTWIDEAHMGAGLVYPDDFRAEWMVVDLETSSVVESARSSLIRDFNQFECQLYGIDRCDSTD